MSELELSGDLESLRKMSVAELVSIQNNFVKAIGNLSISDEESRSYRLSLENLDDLISKLTLLNFESRTLEFNVATKVKDAAARLSENAEQMELAAKKVGNVESIFKIVEQGLKMGALLLGV